MDLRRLMVSPHWFRGLTSLFFPQLCLSCERPIEGDRHLCLSCATEMPLTDTWRKAENRLTDRLAGRLTLQFAASAYIFRTNSVCQQVIHALKYHNRPDIGEKLAQKFGEVIAAAPALADLDGIVPVPIHRKRRHQRGYNQAEAIARGFGTALARPVYRNALRRQTFRGSQTRRSALDRLENVKDSFAIGRGDFRGKHLLLVDDVMTTGATLDFCGNVLLDNHPDLRLSLATLALAV